MSKTDKTRPGWVQEKDPHNQRFRRIVNAEYDWFWKKMFPAHACWCCSQKKCWAAEQRSKRNKGRRDCRELGKGGWRDGT